VKVVLLRPGESVMLSGSGVQQKIIVITRIAQFILGALCGDANVPEMNVWDSQSDVAEDSSLL
jgi:hypothetical protein